MPIPVFAKTYWEIGGAGGPAGAAGAGGGTEAVTAGGGPDSALGVEAPAAGSGVPLETAAGAVEEPCGAGVTGGTGSARSAVVSPLPVGFGASILAASDLPSPGSLSPSYLASVALGLVFSRGLALCGLIPGRIGFGRVSLRSVSLGSIAPGGIYFGQLFAAWLASLAQPLLGARFAAIGPALARGLNWSLTLRSRSCGVGRLHRPRQPLGIAAATRGLGLRR